jgi:uncharacterized protein YbcI
MPGDPENDGVATGGVAGGALIAEPDDGLADGEERRSLYADISREMVRIYKEQFGRGPTKAKTCFADADTIVCTLEDSLTPAERNMVHLGEQQRLRDVRMFFQHATENNFLESIERLTGRKVRAFVSGLDADQDVSAEIFYLEPRKTSP